MTQSKKDSPVNSAVRFANKAIAGVGIVATGLVGLSSSKNADAAPYSYYAPRPPVQREVVEAWRNPRSSGFRVETKHTTIFFQQFNGPPVPCGPVYRPGYVVPGYACPSPVIDVEGVFSRPPYILNRSAPAIPMQSPPVVYKAPQQPAPTLQQQQLPATQNYDIDINNSPGAGVNIGSGPLQITNNPAPVMMQAPPQPVPRPAPLPEYRSVPVKPAPAKYAVQGKEMPAFQFHYNPDEVIRDVEQTKAQIGRMIDYFLYNDPRFPRDWSYTQDIRLDGPYKKLTADVGVKTRSGYGVAYFELTYDGDKNQLPVTRALKDGYNTRTTFINQPMTSRQLFNTVKSTMERTVR